MVRRGSARRCTKGEGAFFSEAGMKAKKKASPGWKLPAKPGGVLSRRENPAGAPCQSTAQEALVVVLRAAVVRLTAGFLAAAGF